VFNTFIMCKDLMITNFQQFTTTPLYKGLDPQAAGFGTVIIAFGITLHKSYSSTVKRPASTLRSEVGYMVPGIRDRANDVSYNDTARVLLRILRSSVVSV